MAGNIPVLVHNCGEATVSIWDPKFENGELVQDGHVSVSVQSGDEILHTERTGLHNGDPSVVQVVPQGRVAPDSTVRIRLPNAAGAIAEQRRALAEGVTDFDRNLNNCVVHCMDVLAGGGVVDAPTIASAGASWLLNK
jgi:hypothetical protein